MSRPKGRHEFTATGGVGFGYVFSVSQNNSGATIDPSTGLYTAGSTEGVTDVVTVTDPAGETVNATVVVGRALAIVPPSAIVDAGAQIAFSGSGGSGTGYVWSIPSNQSGATIDASGLYTAGPTAGTDTVRLTDSLGNTAEAIVTVRAAVSSVDAGSFDLPAVPSAEEDDCSCRTVGASHGHGGGRLVAALALAFGLVLRRRRR